MLITLQNKASAVESLIVRCSNIQITSFSNCSTNCVLCEGLTPHKPLIRHYTPVTVVDYVKQLLC